MTNQYTIPGYIIKGIENSIEISMNCKDEDENIHPKVGAVLIKDEKIVETAYRGEIEPGDHAEFTLLEKKCKLKDFKNTILITTLEPCTVRGANKYPCAERIIEKGIGEIWIGTHDPNPQISGKGITYLRMKGINVEFFPNIYTQKIMQLNKDFFDNELKKYKHDIMLSPGGISVITSSKYKIDEILIKFETYLNQCIDQEDFILCLGEKIPLIKNYNLFNFTFEDIGREDTYQKYPYYLFEHEPLPKSLNFEKFLQDLEENNKKIVVIRGPSGIGKSRLLNHLKYYFSTKTLESKYIKIPILIDLNFWSKEKSIYKFCEEIILNQVSISIVDFKNLLKENRFIILMDAFNELKLKDRIDFIKDFTNFINLYPRINVMISMTTDTEFPISFKEEDLINLWMKPINLNNFRSFYEKINLSIDFDEFTRQIERYNLNKLIKIPLFLNYVIVYLKVEKVLPSSKYEIIDTLLNHYFEDFLKRKYSIYGLKSSSSIWHELLENLSYYMHIKLEENKIESPSLRKIFSINIENAKKKFNIPQDVNVSDLIEFFINYNILKLENSYYKFWHEILFDYYCGLKLSNLINQNKKLRIRNVFHRKNLKESLIIAFPLIENEKFLTICKKVNKFLYIEGLFEKGRLIREEINFMKNFMEKKINSQYFYIQKITYPLIIKLINFIENKEEFLIKLLENERVKRFKTDAILELGKLKTDKANEYLVIFKDDPSSERYRGLALCNYEDQATQDLLINELEEEWFGVDYPSMIAHGFLKLQKNNLLSEITFDRLLNLFINPPKKLKFNFKDYNEYTDEYSISLGFRRGLKILLIKKNDPDIIPKLIDLIDYESLNYFDIVEIISKILDDSHFEEICKIIFNEKVNYNKKIPLIYVIKNTSFKLDFDYILKFINNMPEEIQERKENIFYGNLIELLISKERFLNYDKKKLIEILPPLLDKGQSIQKAIIEVITKFFPKYFFEIITDFKIYYWAFEVLIEVIIHNKYFELKDWLIKHARMCIPNWMHGVRKAFHNWFLFIKILNALIEIDCHKEAKELLDEILNRINDWKRVNPVSFGIINKFEDSFKFPFIEKIYKGYSEISGNEKKHSRNHFIGGIIHPFDSKEYIDFNIQILKESANSDYLLAEDIIRNLISLKPKGIEYEIMQIYNSGVNKHTLPMFIRLVSMTSTEKSKKILKSYLNDEDWLVRNTAFDEIQKMNERDNKLWYNGEEKA